MKHNQIVSAACLLLSIAKADEIIELKEINLTKEIIIDFFDIDSNLKFMSSWNVYLQEKYILGLEKSYIGE